MKNIYLCGFMGAGKSTIGSRVATLLGIKFMDTDNIIEQKEKVSVRDVFEQKGEKYFRDVESAVLKEVAEVKNCIVALGGGACIREENKTILKESGFIIYFNVSFEECYNHIKHSENRPIVCSSSKEDLKNLYDNRNGIYRCVADFVYDVHSSPEYCAKEVTKLIRKYCC